MRRMPTDDKENWSNLVHYVMSCDFSWDVSAKSYEGLYNETDKPLVISAL